MRLLLVGFVATGFIVTPIYDAIAQRPEMPIPNLVVKDGDGKGMAQVHSFYSDNFNPVVLFNSDRFVPDILFQTSFAITVPDMVTEVNRVFRSTPPAGTPVTINFHREQTEDSAFLGHCTPDFSWVYTLAPAKEILPDPLDRFHGPLLRPRKNSDHRGRHQASLIQGGTI